MDTTEPADAAPAAAAATASIKADGTIDMEATSVLAHAALDALDVADKYRQPLSAWWTAHEQWCAAFPPASLDDLVKPPTPPSFGHVKIRNPSLVQRNGCSRG